ncbi:MAG: hypothetical protein V3T07_04315 [Myxococcota bacterium]
MIVEFVGLGGCGKSTVSHAVADVLRGALQPVSERSFEIAHRLAPSPRRLAKLRLALRTVLLRPRSALSLVFEIARGGQYSWREGIAKTSDLLYICGLIAQQSRRPGIHLFDQGFFGGLWSVCFRARSSLPLERLVELGTRCCGRSPADLVVVLEVEPATAVARLHGRSGTASRLELRMAHPAFERDLHRAISSLRHVRETVCARERAWDVHALRNDEAGAPDACASEIADRILRCLSGALPASELEWPRPPLARSARTSRERRGGPESR